MAYDPSEFRMREGPFIPPKKATKADDKAAIEDTRGAPMPKAAPKPKRYARGGGIELRGKTKGIMR